MTKKKDKRIQKTIKVIDVSTFGPLYETVSNKINTVHTMKNKKEYSDPHLCKCNDNLNSNRFQTEESVFKTYGSSNTEIRDKDAQKSKKIKTKSHDENPKTVLKKHYKLNEKNKKPKRNKKHERNKKSLISFYHVRRKYNKNNNKPNTNLGNNSKNENLQKESPVIHLNISKKPKHRPNYHDGKGDSCIRELCTNNISDYYKPGNEKYLSKGIIDKFKTIDMKKHKNVGKLKTKKENVKKVENINKVIKQSSLRNQIVVENKNYKNLPISSENIRNVFSKCKNFLKYSLSNKIQNIIEKPTVEPVFVMQVSSADMHVLNPFEIQDKVKQFGRPKQHRSCVCPSRMKRLKKGRHKICAKGMCESNLKHNKTHFNCKCTEKNKTISCKDTTCNSKNKKMSELLKSSKHKKDSEKPVIEVVLDQSNMNIINSNEMRNFLKNTYQPKICPNGICQTAYKDPEIKLKCKCSRRKIISKSLECTNKTCTPQRKCTLSSLCSRVFSRPEYWFRIDKRRNVHYRNPIVKQNTKSRNVNRKHINVNSDIVPETIITPIDRRGYVNKQSGDDVWCKCYCECDTKYTTFKEEVNKPKKKKKQSSKKKDKRKAFQPLKSIKHSKCRRRKKQNDWKSYVIKCLKRKRKRCDKKLKDKEKEFKKSEKEALKQELKMQKNEKKNKAEDHHWNCLTKFVSGLLNLGVQIVKGVFSIAFALLFNPIGSYIYIRERAKNPAKTFKKIKVWLSRTWTNKASNVSQTVKESDTMNVIADQIEDTAIYNALFANKGKTKAEKLQYEIKARLRKRRIQKRQDAALYGCRHMLLTTMRKTPCLWFYHICPDLYPQCLSMVNFMRNFVHVIIFLVAFICWTPCIITFELCRAFMCCFFCTN